MGERDEAETYFEALLVRILRVQYAYGKSWMALLRSHVVAKEEPYTYGPNAYAYGQQNGILLRFVSRFSPWAVVWF